MTDTELPPPVFAHVEPGRHLTVGEAAPILDAAAPSSTDWGPRLRRFIRAGLVPTRGKRGSGPTAASTLAPADLLTAATMGVLGDAGLAVEGRGDEKTGEIGKAASLALAAWDHHHTKKHGAPRTAHPVTSAAFAALADKPELWVLHITRFRHETTADVVVRGICYGMNAPFPPYPGMTPDSDGGFLPELDIRVALTPMAERIFATYAATAQAADPATPKN